MPANPPTRTKSAPQPKPRPATTDTPKQHPATQTRSFRARLEPDHTSLKWVIARVPFNIAETWTRMRRLRVRGEINGFAFRTSLFPLPAGQTGHFLLVNKPMQTAAGVSVGREADFTLEPDLEERSAALPAELKLAFGADRNLLRYTGQLSESTRRELAKWISAVKGPDARARRSAQLAERLLLTMEGEQTAPPVLEALFSANPRARSAWNALTPNQRRSQLLGIFFYQSPEARLRRAEKAIAEALQLAAKATQP